MFRKWWVQKVTVTPMDLIWDCLTLNTMKDGSEQLSAL